MHYLIFDEISNFYSFGDLKECALPDFTIYCKSYTFAVHNLLLRTWIPYFQHLQSFKEKKSDELILNDDQYNPDIIHALLAYCHCRDVEIDFERQDMLSLIRHAGYWEYDDFILWLLHKYLPSDFPTLFEALQEIRTEQGKKEIALMVLQILEIPLQEDSHVFLTWLKNQDISLQNCILSHCSQGIRDAWKIMSTNQVIYPKIRVVFRDIRLN